MYRKNGLLTINKKSKFIKDEIDININKDKFTEAVFRPNNPFNNLVTNINGTIINNNRFNNTINGNTPIYNNRLNNL